MIVSRLRLALTFGTAALSATAGVVLVSMEDTLEAVEAREAVAEHSRFADLSTMSFIPEAREVNLTTMGLSGAMLTLAIREAAATVSERNATLDGVGALGSFDAIEASFCRQSLPLPFSAGASIRERGEDGRLRAREPWVEDLVPPTDEEEADASAVFEAYKSGGTGEGVAIAVVGLLLGHEEAVKSRRPSVVEQRQREGLDELLMQHEELQSLLPETLGRIHGIRELLGRVSTGSELQQCRSSDAK